MRLVFFVFIFIFLIGLASACPELHCSNFTDSDRREDCNYVIHNGLSDDEEQELLCILWENSYEFEPWQPTETVVVVPDFGVIPSNIDNSRFILAGKIFLFCLFNYFVFSLSKSSFIRKWLNADS